MRVDQGEKSARRPESGWGSTGRDVSLGVRERREWESAKQSASTRPLFPVVFTSTLGKNVLKMEVI